MVIPCAAPRSAWMGGFLSLTGNSSVAKAGEVLGCGPSLLLLYTSSWTWDSALLSSGEAECCFSRPWLLFLLISMFKFSSDHVDMIIGIV